MSSNLADPSTTTATTSTKTEQIVPPQLIPSPTRPEPPAIAEPLVGSTTTKSPLTRSASRAVPIDSNLSEAETEILSDAAVGDVRRRIKKQENGLRKEKERERGAREVKERAHAVNRRGAGGESPRKRRKRSVSRSRIADRDERRPKSVAIKDDPDDAAFSSDLSSALSSRHVSPAHLRRRMPTDRIERSSAEQPAAPRPHSLPQTDSTAVGDSRKRKVPPAATVATAATAATAAAAAAVVAAVDGSTSSDDNQPRPPRQKSRPRRNSALDASSPARRQSVSKFSPSSPMRASSPISRGAASRVSSTAQTGNRQQRSRPPPLRPTHENEQNSESDTDSSTSSRSSPHRLRRLQSAAARTPGSPINMSHRPKRDTAGRTHLHRACGKGIVADVEAILEQGVELINSEDNAGYRPIHEASLKGHLDIVKVLVKYGADFDVQSKVDLESPLLDAVENGHVLVVRYLLELGADPRKRDQRGRSCLDANRDHSDDDGEEDIRKEIESILKSAVGKRRLQRPSDDETRASAPAPDRDSRSSRDPSVTSPARQSPPAPIQGPRRRNARAEQSRKDLLWLDSGKGSVIKLREKAREGDNQMVHALLETGLKPDNETLIGAIKGGHTECVNLLLAYSGDADPAPGQLDGEGRRKKREASMPVGEETPMLAAIGRGNVEILKMLLDNNVDPKRRDVRGKNYIQIAKEREGDNWQQEVQILEQAWQKAGGKKSTEKSPQHLKALSPKAPIKQQPRRSSSTSSRNQSRPPKIKEEKGSNRSLSANPPHRLDDSAVVSDRESTAEPPLGPPKIHMGISRRSGSDSLTPSSPKRRRRLVSGKVRDEEAMSKVSDSTSDKKRQPTKSSKRSDSEYGDTIRVEQPPNKKLKAKSEPSEDTKMIDAPPLDRRKVKEKERERLGSVKNSETRESKRPGTNRERSRSPPRGPRLDIEKRQEIERRRQRDNHRDERVHRRRESIDLENRRTREQRGSVSSEPGRHRDESRRPVQEKSRLTEEERRRRIKDKESEKEKKNGVAERESKGLKSIEKRDKERKRIKVEKEQEEADNLQLEQEARELVRQKHLTKEQTSIIHKAGIESKKARENDVIIRELQNRAIREEEMRKERLNREREEREQEEREALEKARKEKEAREKEERERIRAEREAKEKAAREQEEKERIQREEEEKAIRERIEKERIEREAKEAQEAEERRLEEERQRELELKRQEEERIRIEEEKQKKLQAEREELLRKEAEKLRLEQERRLEKLRLEEAEAQRKAAAEEARKRQIEEKEARDRKIAEELQQQLAKEQEKAKEEQELKAKEKARIQALPYILRKSVQRAEQNLPPEDFSRFFPLYAVTFPDVVPNTTPCISNGVSQNGEKYVLNIQCALALGINDLDLSGYREIERRPLNEHQRIRMWCGMNPMLNNISWNKTIQEQLASTHEEKRKFLAMEPLFWIKFRDFMSIISTDPQYAELVNHPVTTTEVSMELPTPGKGSPPSDSPRPSREEMQMRLKKRLRTSSTFNVSPDPTPTKKLNMNGSRTPPLPAYASKPSSMPPPNFAPSSTSTFSG